MYKLNIIKIIKVKSIFRNSKIKFEFHIANKIRRKYEIEEELFTITGNVVLANFYETRKLAQKINAQRDSNNKVTSGEINAVGLLDEIYHYLFNQYQLEKNPNVFKKALNCLNNNLKEIEIDILLKEFVQIFPPISVYRNEISVDQYLEGSTENKTNKEIVLEEFILLHFANLNTAANRIKELYNDEYFSNQDGYSEAIKLLDTFFQNEEKFGPENQDIFTFFKTPILKEPYDLGKQLDFIFEKWKIILTDEFLKRILRSQDLFKEEYKLGFGGAPPTVVPKYKGQIDDADSFTLGKSGYRYGLHSYFDYEEYERFTKDIEWMPNVVLLAKNVHVWLDQLSKKYERPINRLDQIPDEELNSLAQWNFTGLWLIGIWERSPASKEIKHRMGNIDAVASAYSLFDYQIANDLGGEWAYNNLNERCKARGIRLASDMVPNHTGIYSDWIINHPDYFIQLDYPPFPNYSFNGPNLSEHPDIEIRIEDGYWNKTDASVVFQRIDKRYGDVKYIYHGNDGTSMPWNDTAQLNMLKKEVREAVIGKIFEVARKFSIIRFDAAMTLTKRHFSRLWFPPPGSGGDIPSRSDYGLTKEEFDAFFPEEFWREVVDKINSELPNTLLLAEAFWLLEGYFVRTLGMHRVYNSAFMNMLMREENSKYRDLITNTLEFEPEILKRYVNFMSNPDEETAIKQFGTGDKYFGIVTMMVTLPGLPMFAHGQIEGLTEKYGMEYKRAYYNETPQQWLVEKHQSEIFPLVGKRYLFSQVDNFWFYDFLNDNGHINENVFAYTNAAFGDKALILFNNKYEDTSGKIDFSTPKLTTQNGNKNLLAIKLADALEIKADNNFFYIYHELKTGLEYIREGKDFHHYGYHTHLKAFEYKVFLSFRELYDTTGELRKLYQQLNGQGVPNISNSIEELRLKPIHIEFEKVLSPQTIKSGYGSLIKLKDQFDDTKSELINAFGKLQTEITNYYKINESQSELKEELIRDFLKIESLNKILQQDFPSEKNIFNKKLNKSVQLSIGVNYRENMLIAGILFLCKQIKEIFSDNENLKNIWFDLLMLSIPIKNILSRLGRSNNDIENDITLIKILLEFDFEVFDVRNIRVTNNNKITKTFIDQMLFENKLDEFEKLLENDFVKNYININYHEGIMYYSKELFENLVDWLFTLSLLNYFEIPKTENKKTTKATISAKEKPSLIKLTFEIVKHIKQISVDSKYQMEVLIYKLTHV